MKCAALACQRQFLSTSCPQAPNAALAAFVPHFLRYPFDMLQHDYAYVPVQHVLCILLQNTAASPFQMICVASLKGKTWMKETLLYAPTEVACRDVASLKGKDIVGANGNSMSQASCTDTCQLKINRT